MGRTRTTLFCLAVAVTVAPTLATADSDRAELTRRLGADLHRAEAALRAGHTADAETLYREALDDARALGERSLPLARSADGLADTLRESGRLAEAEPLYAQAAELWESLLGPTQPRLAITLHNLGVVRARLGNPTAATAPLQRALEIWITSYGTDSSEAQNTRRALSKITE